MAWSMPPMYWSIGSPVVDDAPVERRGVRCADRRSAGSTTTSRRTCPSCPPRAVPCLPQRGHGHVQPLLVGGERRHALRPVVLDLGQQQRQLVVRDGNDAVSRRSRRWESGSPSSAAARSSSRAGDTRRPARPSLARGATRRCAFALVGGQAVELARVDEHAVLGDDLDDGQVERLGELAVALVVRGHGHDRAGAVLHQHVVGDVHGQPLAVDGVRRVEAGEDAGLLLLGRPLLAAPGRRLLRVRPNVVVVDALDERMLGRQDEERRAEQRVGPRREDGNVRVELVDPEQDLRALRATDPVALDRLRPLRPPRRPSGRSYSSSSSAYSVMLEEPLLEVARLDLRAAALAAAVDDVLVRDDRLVVRAPVDRRRLAVGEAALEEPQEQPLRPAVEAGLVGRDLAVPVDRPAEPLHLLADDDDVALGDLPRMAALA